eukprot:scaffold69046_cov77-Phaeocystis_antarctica.AAC.5
MSCSSRTDAGSTALSSRVLCTRTLSPSRRSGSAAVLATFLMVMPGTCRPKGWPRHGRAPSAPNALAQPAAAPAPLGTALAAAATAAITTSAEQRRISEVACKGRADPGHRAVAATVAHAARLRLCVLPYARDIAAPCVRGAWCGHQPTRASQVEEVSQRHAHAADAAPRRAVAITAARRLVGEVRHRPVRSIELLQQRCVGGGRIDGQVEGGVGVGSEHRPHRPRKVRAVTGAAVRRRLVHHLQVGERPLVSIDARDIGALVLQLAHVHAHARGEARSTMAGQQHLPDLRYRAQRA